MNTSLTIIALVRAKAGYEEELLSAQSKLVEATKSSPGCLRYELNVSLRDGRTIAFVEQWESPALWHQHMGTSYMQTFRETAGHLIEDFELLEMRQVA
jgi:quinol monooxygenase YgiN